MSDIADSPGLDGLESCHGPDKAAAADVKPEGTMGFVFETRDLVRPTAWAATAPTMQRDPEDVWTAFTRAGPPR